MRFEVSSGWHFVLHGRPLPRVLNTVLNVRLQGTRTAVHGTPHWGTIGSPPWLGNTVGCVRGGACDRLSDDEMHDQQHHDHVMAVNRIDLQVAETTPQPFLDANEGEEVLKKDESRVRCQVLRFESDIQTQPGFTTNIGSAMFHLRGLRFIWYFSVSQRLLYQSRRPHIFSLYAFSSQTTQYGIAEIQGHLCAWLNLTGGELDPHATLTRMPYVL